MAADVQQLIASARKGEVGLVHVIVGEETFLVERAVGLLRAAAVGQESNGFNEDLFHGQGRAGTTETSTASTLPMMASRRFVLVRGVDAMNAEQQEPLAAYLKDPSPSTCLVLTAAKLDGRGKLAKSAKKLGAWVDARPMKGGDLRRFASSECRSRGHDLRDEAAHALMDAIGEDLAALDDALERLSLYVGEGQSIDLLAVEACVTRIRTETIWELVDAVGLGDSGRAMRAVASLLADREPPLRILAMLARQLRIVARMRSALGRGLPDREAAKEAGVPPWKAGEMKQAARRLNLAALGRAFSTLAETDRLLKGSRQLPEAVLEQAVLQLCRD